MIAFLYRALTDVSAWPIRLWLRLRALRGKEEPLRLDERRGVSQIPRPPGTLVWCHAASVGESTALLSLISRLQDREATTVLLTTGTTSSARIMAERLPDSTIHQFAPWDRRGWVARFLNHWQPDLAIRMESEIWPNTIGALRDGDVPVAVVSARLSDASARGWHRARGFAKSIFEQLTLVLAQSAEHGKRFSALGAPEVTVTGNLKLCAAPLPAPKRAQDALRAAIGQRPVWLAASTHSGEEAIAFDIHAALKNTFPDLLTIVAPRHPERRGEITKELEQRALRYVHRSTGQVPDPDDDIYIVDTFGDLGVLFSVVPVVFMGKSLTSHGGQNPLEPIRFGCAVVFGPYMENFEDLAPSLTMREIAVQVDSAQGLSDTVRLLLGNADQRAKMQEAATGFLRDGELILDSTVHKLEGLLSRVDTDQELRPDGR